MDTQTLAALVRRAQNGDTRAQQELYVDGSKSVFFNALKILRNREDAEDITQDVFITVFEKLPELKNPSAYYKWVNQITANKCMSFLRKHKPIPTDDVILDILELDESDAETPEKLLDDEATRRIIMEIIDALPDSQRVCVMYRYFNQLSIEEIAAITETNEHTVKSRLALARNKIRAAILEKEEKDGIRLHVLIPIMPVLMKALDEFQMPDGVQARMWDNIQKELTGKGQANGNAEQARINNMINSNGAAKSAGKAAVNMISKKVMIAAVSVIGVAAIIAGIIFLPPLFSPSDTTPTPGVSDTQTPGGTETPDNTPSGTETSGTSETPTIPDIPEALASDFEYEVTADGVVITKYIGKSAEVRVPEKIDGKPVVEIAKQAFLFNDSLTAVIIPNSVTTIGQDAFNGCQSLMNLTISNSVKTIGVMAFYRCGLLTNLIIPASVTEIGDQAFANCISLTSATINATASFGQEIFGECDSLKSVTFGSGVTKIDESAFRNCTSIKNITIPDSVIEIGNMAFVNSGIESITIPESVSIMGDNVFMGCTSLKSVTLNGALPDNPQSSHQFFDGCSSLTSVTIGDKATAIADYLFSGLQSLKSVQLGNNITSIGSTAFRGCSALENITLHDSITYIGSSAFAFCESLTSVNIPRGVTKIDEAVFSQSGLTSITIPSWITTIEYSAFSGCEKLGNLTIENGVTSIGEHAFSGCKSLSSVAIPDSVTKIAAYQVAAFTDIPNFTATYKGITYASYETTYASMDSPNEKMWVMPNEFYEAINNG